MQKRNRNKKSPGRTVLYQWIKDVNTSTTYSGERSPYWDWVNTHRESSVTETDHEPERANPDYVTTTTDDYSTRRISQGDFLTELFNRLSKQETKVLALMQQNADQITIGNTLKISQSRVSQILKSIRRKAIKLGYKISGNVI